MKLAHLCLCYLLVVFSSILLSGSAQAETNLKWELVNPFRLFSNPQFTNFHKIIYEQLTDEERKTPILSVERRLSAHLPYGWAENLLDKTCWSRKNNNYDKCTNKKNNYLHPKSHQIWSEYQGGGSLAVGDLTCRWQLINLKIKKKAGELITKPCDERVKFDIPYPSGARLKLQVSDGSSIEETIKVKDIFVVGIGDSFASGEGNPDVPVRFSSNRFMVYGASEKSKIKGLAYPTRVGTWTKLADVNFMKEKARWQGQSCHRSLYSHQLRASLQLALETPKRAVTFAGFACAGAEITHGLFLRFRGNEWSASPPKLSQISAVADAQCGEKSAQSVQYARAFGVDGKLEILHDLPILKCPHKKARKIDLLMVSVGGNDVNFSSLVANVVVKDSFKLKTIGGWMGHILNHNQARQKLGVLKLRYKALRRALHNVLQISWKQSDRILLTAYPNMTFRDEGRNVCADGRLGMDVSPLFSLSSLRAKRAEQFAERLNKAMRVTARRYRWTYVDGHRRAFLSHGICAVDEERTEKISEKLQLPFWKNGNWEHYNPADYPPFASRARWFRTPNDAYLTGHLHFSGSIIRKFKKLEPLQVLIAGTYSGAFHPTAEGQAVIADALTRAATGVLQKYGQ